MKHTGAFRLKIRILTEPVAWAAILTRGHCNDETYYQMTQKHNFRQYRTRPLSLNGLVKSLSSHTEGVHCTTGYLLLTVRQMSLGSKLWSGLVYGWSKQEGVRTRTPWLSMNTLPYVWRPNEQPTKKLFRLGNDTSFSFNTSETRSRDEQPSWVKKLWRVKLWNLRPVMLSDRVETWEI